MNLAGNFMQPGLAQYGYPAHAAPDIVSATIAASSMASRPSSPWLAINCKVLPRKALRETGESEPTRMETPSSPPPT